jgi:hypothetical protein
LSYKFIKNFDKGSDYIVTNLLVNLPPLEKRGIISEKPTEVTESSVEVEFDFENPEEMMKLDISEKMIIKIESLKENESDQICVECEKRNSILSCKNCKTKQCFECALAIHLDTRFKENLTHELSGIL